MSIALQSRFVRELPELAVPWKAEAAPEPSLVALNEPLAVELGLDPAWLRSPEGLGLLVGTLVPGDATPAAQAYAGHQFGGYVPRLGDGRALLLGEIVDASGRVRDLHLKGSGRTPFARGGDGLAAVGPMVREYVISEAMHALHIPTTRALAVVATGRPVYRETALPGAVLARVADSHLRVGSFQYAAAVSQSTGNLDLLRRLADHAIARHHPGAAAADNPYLALLEAVSAVQADLIARWMLAGFVHGVMNTDNMTISGQTIDYGPCAFMESFDPATVFSSIDSWGRYAYGNQPSIALWNLARFAETLLPLLADNIDDPEKAIALAEATLDSFAGRYEQIWSAGMRAKLGVADAPADVVGPLVEELLTQMQQSQVDHTSFYRRLSRAARGDAEPVRGEFIDLAAFDDWTARWRALGPDPDAMDRINPIYIPRNHLVEEALTAVTAGDTAPLEKLLEAVRAPFDERAGLERYAEPGEKEFSASFQTFCGT
ncbi:protein adenylyltransferase SelO [Mycolicibacterium pyrenivorans]|uniref:protein adenylyltransferase SelO n=1 Tax=Mycolicibacterium pyrenivorans TaxID=187102 RepID=UPI0021F2DEB4|nr:YdiU family protein [Mycolicibacterium pyrenivorans]MCV7153792.1 YdiU family protein [Mycolicibacterium pyrenivorans]